jgi:hypothetical protein
MFWHVHADLPADLGACCSLRCVSKVRAEGRQRKKHGKPKGGGKSGAQLKTKSWVLKKKAQMRGKGYTAIPVDTKYTARKRKKGF